MKKWWKDPIRRKVISQKISQTLKNRTPVEIFKSFRAMFNGKYEKDDKGCFIFTGSKRRGQGVIMHNYKQYNAHRLAYILKYGPITDPHALVLHRCGQKACINPEHLYLGSHFDL